MACPCETNTATVSAAVTTSTTMKFALLTGLRWCSSIRKTKATSSSKLSRCSHAYVKIAAVRAILNKIAIISSLPKINNSISSSMVIIILTRIRKITVITRVTWVSPWCYLSSHLHGLTSLDPSHLSVIVEGDTTAATMQCSIKWIIIPWCTVMQQLGILWRQCRSKTISWWILMTNLEITI